MIHEITDNGSEEFYNLNCNLKFFKICRSTGVFSIKPNGMYEVGPNFMHGGGVPISTQVTYVNGKTCSIVYRKQP